MLKSREEVLKIKEEYPIGTKIEMVKMEDSQAIPSGTKGVVKIVDDQGQLHMEWENGRSLAVVPDIDEFIVLQNPIQVLVLPPNGKAYIKNICEDPETVQELVEGHIQYVTIEYDAVLVCNVEDKFLGLTPDRRVGNYIICGNFFIAGRNDSEYLVSLTEKQIEEYQEKFMRIEELEVDYFMEFSNFIK